MAMASGWAVDPQFGKGSRGGIPPCQPIQFPQQHPRQLVTAVSPIFLAWHRAIRLSLTTEPWNSPLRYD
jgi:hypothetical protein